MLAYAASRPAVAQRGSAPHAMLLIIAAHVAVVAAVMSARMDLPQRIGRSPLVVNLIPERDPPPPEPRLQPKRPATPTASSIDQPVAIVPTPAPDREIVDPTPLPFPNLDPLPGPTADPSPRPDPTPPAAVAARLLTSGAELKPAYPASKLASGEEALLRLRLSIDERGRVVAVDPAGPADRAFLDAARRHLIAHWRYKPANAGGRPVASSAVITLRFQLEG